jgi:hypothetical protein
MHLLDAVEDQLEPELELVAVRVAGLEGRVPADEPRDGEGSVAHMIAQGSGVILTISTPGARLTGRGLILNAAQSAALEMFSRALAD